MSETDSLNETQQESSEHAVKIYRNGENIMQGVSVQQLAERMKFKCFTRVWKCQNE